MKMTEGNTTLTLIVLLSYSGKWDILQAVKKVAAKAASSPEALEEVLSMNVEDFDPYLATAGIPDPDLMIRTSGEIRLSNFLLWELSYSEIYVTELLWPEFNEEEFRKILMNFGTRERRFGGRK